MRRRLLAPGIVLALRPRAGLGAGHGPARDGRHAAGHPGADGRTPAWAGSAALPDGTVFFQEGDAGKFGYFGPLGDGRRDRPRRAVPGPTS